MKVLKIIGVILLILIVALGIISFTTTTKFALERSIEIDAPKEEIKKEIIYFKNWEKWSPFADLDPNMQEEYKGEAGKIGSSYHWDGNDEAGKGNLTLVENKADKVVIDMQFLGSFESTAQNYFLFDEQGETTQVSWGFTSEMPRPFNLFGVFFNLEEEIGKDYEKGLQDLKTLCETN